MAIKQNAVRRHEGEDLEPEATRAAAIAPAAGRVAELDNLIHERIRLGIVSVLAVHETLTFTDLKRLLGASDGNLSTHARKLEKAEYIAVRKFFRRRVPVTEFRLTEKGRRSLQRYLDHMQALIEATRQT